MNIRHDLRTGTTVLTTPLGDRAFDLSLDSDRQRLARLLRIHAEREAGFAHGHRAEAGSDSATAVLAYDLARVKRYDGQGRKTLSLADLED